MAVVSKESLGVAPLQRSKQSTQWMRTTLHLGLCTYPLGWDALCIELKQHRVPQGCRKASPPLIIPLTSATREPGVDPESMAAQRCYGGQEPLTGSGLGVGQRYTAHPSPAAAPTPQPCIPPSIFPMAQMLFGVAQDLCLQVHKEMAAPRAATPLYFMPWSLSCCIWLVLYSAAGLEQGQGHHMGLGCQVLDQQHLSFSKTLHILPSLPCRERSQSPPCSNCRRSIPSCRSCSSTVSSPGSGWPKSSISGTSPRAAAWATRSGAAKSASHTRGKWRHAAWPGTRSTGSRAASPWVTPALCRARSSLLQALYLLVVVPLLDVCACVCEIVSNVTLHYQGYNESLLKWI